MAGMAASGTTFLTRFAPAPTGFLHLGHVVNALYVWGLAAQAGGRVLVRIEDHDRQRSRPAYTAAILEDLAWLGFTGHGAVSLQSERQDVYRAALSRLVAAGRGHVGRRCGILVRAPHHERVRVPRVERRRAHRSSSRR